MLDMYSEPSERLDIMFFLPHTYETIDHLQYASMLVVIAT